jgi:putative membrane protein
MKKLGHTVAISLAIALPAMLVGYNAFAAGLSHRDSEFIAKASQAGMTEVQAGKLAQSQSTDPAVQGFGKQMADDHGKAGDELAGIAKAKGVTPPGSPDKSQRKLLAKLEKLQGREFDKKYAKEAGVSAHKDAVKLFTSEANKGEDPDLRAFAVNTLPTIQHHYAMAQELAKAH